MDAFERHVQEHLCLTQIPNMTAIWMEIQQLYDKIRIAAPAPLMIHMPDITILVLDWFADEHTAYTSGKRHVREIMVLRILGDMLRGWIDSR